MAQVIGIATRRGRKMPMITSISAAVTFEKGVGNDSRGLFKGDRQVTVMAKESWALVCKEMGFTINWTTRRANILVEGLNLENTKGMVLKIGDVQLEITGELVPCNRMDEQVLGLTNALAPNWRGGVTCKILSEGTINENDVVSLNPRN